jgi:hypothetical protein
LIDRVLSAAD